MKIWKYANYAEYVAAQTEANKRKIENVWVRPETIAEIAKHCNPKSILCHGTRNGAEQTLFWRQFPGCVVLGTEISETAKLFPFTKQHDFHDELPMWFEAWDVIYSNSLDHAYDPARALRTWRGQLAPKGRMFIEFCFTETTNICDAVDAFQVSFDELVGLFEYSKLKVVTTFEAGGVKGAPECASVVFVLEKV